MAESFSKTEPWTQLNIRISGDLYARLRKEAADSGVPMTRIARQGIEHVLEHGYQRGDPRQAAREALGILDETPGALGREIVPEVIASESPEKKDSPTEADATEGSKASSLPSAPASPSPEAWGCPIPECTFQALSKAAICPTHGRKVQ